MSVERVWLGPDEQYIPDAGRWADHGDVVELPEAPDKNDPRFGPKTAKKATHVKPEENV